MSGVKAIVVAHMEESRLTLHGGLARLPADRRNQVARTAEGAMGNFEKLGILVIIVLVVVLLVLAVWGMGVPQDELGRVDLGGRRIIKKTRGGGEPAKKADSPGKKAVELTDKPAKDEWWKDDPNDKAGAGAGTGSTPEPKTDDRKVDPVEPAPVRKDLSHTIAKNDNFSSLSRKYYGHERYWRSIQRANPTVTASNMKIGDVLVIPNPEIVKSGATPKRGDGNKADANATANVANPGRTYTARKGDTLTAVASKMLGSATRWRKILEANRKLLRDDPRNLQPGMILTIP
jgi:nucleoid-associated protein YgaU